MSSPNNNSAKRFSAEATPSAPFNSFLFFSLPDLKSDGLANDLSSLSLGNAKQTLSSQPERDESTHESSSPCEPFDNSSNSEKSMERPACLSDEEAEPCPIGDDLLKMIDSCSNSSDELEASPAKSSEAKGQAQSFNSIFSSPSQNYLEMPGFTSEPVLQQTATSFGQIPQMNQYPQYQVPTYTQYQQPVMAAYASVPYECMQAQQQYGRFTHQQQFGGNGVNSQIQIPDHFQQQQYLPKPTEMSRKQTPKKITDVESRKRPSQPKQEPFDFPEGGWECSKCQNYNFKGRKECHRCKKPKCAADSDGKPEHMLKNGKKQYQQQQQRKSRPSKPVKKPAHEHQGDWVCGKCHNLNFAFRSSCNMCGSC